MSEKQLQDVITHKGRLKALHDLSLIENPSETVYDPFTRIAHEVLRIPVSLVSLVAEDYQFFKSHFGLPEPWKSARRTPLSHSFCKHVISTNEPLIVEDAPNDPLVRDNLAIPDLNVIAYLGVPLTLADGMPLGSFCAIDERPKQWDEIDLAIMAELGQIISREFDLRTLVYIDPARWIDLQAMHGHIAEFVENLDTSLSKVDFLRHLLAMRRKYQL